MKSMHGAGQLATARIELTILLSKWSNLVCFPSKALARLATVGDTELSVLNANSLLRAVYIGTKAAWYRSRNAPTRREPALLFKSSSFARLALSDSMFSAANSHSHAEMAAKTL